MSDSGRVHFKPIVRVKTQKACVVLAIDVVVEMRL